MRILVPPVILGTRICRVVSPVESLLEVEEWVGEWWEPSSVTISEASLAPLASRAVLVAAGIPSGDHAVRARRTPNDELQAMMRSGEEVQQDLSIPDVR